MSSERPPAANDNAPESGRESVHELAVRIRELVESVDEALQVAPQVLIKGEPVEFSLERDPDLVHLSRAQQLVLALDAELAKMREEGAEPQPHIEQLLELAKGYVGGLVQALEHRADAVTAAERDPAVQELVQALDALTRQLLPANDNESALSKVAA